MVVFGEHNAGVSRMRVDIRKTKLIRKAPSEWQHPNHGEMGQRINGATESSAPQILSVWIVEQTDTPLRCCSTIEYGLTSVAKANAITPHHLAVYYQWFQTSEWVPVPHPILTESSHRPHDG
jgi:hypothetical protein